LIKFKKIFIILFSIIYLLIAPSYSGSGESVADTTTPVSAKLFVPAMTNNTDNRDIRSVSNVAGDNATNAGTISASHDYFQGILALAAPPTTTITIQGQ